MPQQFISSCGAHRPSSVSLQSNSTRDGGIQLISTELWDVNEAVSEQTTLLSNTTINYTNASRRTSSPCLAHCVEMETQRGVFVFFNVRLEHEGTSILVKPFRCSRNVNNQTSSSKQRHLVHLKVWKLKEICLLFNYRRCHLVLELNVLSLKVKTQLQVKHWSTLFLGAVNSVRF